MNQDSTSKPQTSQNQPHPSQCNSAQTSEVNGHCAPLTRCDFDDAGRLAAVFDNGLVVEAYGYDDNGRRIHEFNKFKPEERRTFAYAKDMLLRAGCMRIFHDDEGRISSKEIDGRYIHYDYSLRGLLQQVNEEYKRFIEYAYDHRGRCVEKRLNNMLTESYVWTDDGRIECVRFGADVSRMHFSYTDSRPSGMEFQGRFYTLETLPNGSVSAVLDDSGTEVKRIFYDSFGRIRRVDGRDFPMPLGFTGRLHDQHSGLVRFPGREYDPDIGRFLIPDPLGPSPSNGDRYALNNNNPLSEKLPTLF